MLKNFNSLEEKLAKQRLHSVRSSEVLEENLSWISSYIRGREIRGAQGILCFEGEYAWDQNSKFKWRLDDPNFQEKITKFYDNYR